MRARLYCVDSESVTLVQVNEELTHLHVTGVDGSIRPCRYFTVEIGKLCDARWIRENVTIVNGQPILPDCEVTVLDQGDGFGPAPKEEET